MLIQIDLAPDPSLLAIMVIFWLNYIVVRKFFLQPVNEVIESRDTEIRSADKLYEESLARFNEATSKMEQEIHAAKREASQVREKARAEAGTQRQGMIERTSGEAKQIVAEADTRLSADVSEARETIIRESESLARLAAERILGRAV